MHSGLDVFERSKCSGVGKVRRRHHSRGCRRCRQEEWEGGTPLSGNGRQTSCPGGWSMCALCATSWSIAVQTNGRGDTLGRAKCDYYTSRKCEPTNDTTLRKTHLQEVHRGELKLGGDPELRTQRRPRLSPVSTASSPCVWSKALSGSAMCSGCKTRTFINPLYEATPGYDRRAVQTKVAALS